MKSTNMFKGALAVASCLLPLSQSVVAEEVEASWNISGWINEGVFFYDDGESSDAVQLSDNGTTLGNRITFSGSAKLPNSGLEAGFEVIVEPLSNTTPLIFSNQENAGDTTGGDIDVLGQSVYVGGAFGKITLGLQSMPTDNIAVLADPSLTLWSSISPVFRGNGFAIQGLDASANNKVWGSFLNCLTAEGLSAAGGIGIDCNGIYRNGVRYDLPALGPVNVAIGYANDDVYDIALKYNGQLGERIKTIVHIGYAVNQGVDKKASAVGATEAENFQIQIGLSDTETGLFGTFAYQLEDASNAAAGSGSDTNAWWYKGGIKRSFTNWGDTALTFQYGLYNDQYGGAADGITGSEVQRVGFAIDQYFGSKFIIYGAWENLALDVDGDANTQRIYGGAESLDIFSIGFTYFF